MARYLQVSTAKYADEAKFIEDVRTTFGLTQPPFDDMDDDLLYLAMTAQCQNSQTSKRAQAKYGTCDFETLEFYGDLIFYYIFAMLTYNVFQLHVANPEKLTRFRHFFTSNRLMTDIMLSKNACRFVRSPGYTISFDQQKFHNRCADAFEALFGALYVHLKSKNVDVAQTIYRWAFDNLDLAHWIRSYVQDKPVETYTDTSAVQTQRRHELADIGTDLESLGLDDIEGLTQALTSAQNNVTEGVPTTSLLLSSGPIDVAELYEQLGWTGPVDSYDFKNKWYEVYAYPEGEQTVVGYADTTDDIDDMALRWLLTNGYYTRYRPPEYRFSRPY